MAHRQRAAAQHLRTLHLRTLHQPRRSRQDRHSGTGWKFQFTITSVSYAESVGDTADGFGDTAQGKYTILHVTVTNIGSQPQTLDDSSQYVYDASGRKYDASTSADIDLNSASGSDSVFFNDINPGNTVHGELAFDMPTGLKAVKAELHDSVFSGGVTVNLR